MRPALARSIAKHFSGALAAAAAASEGLPLEERVRALQSSLIAGGPRPDALGVVTAAAAAATAAASLTTPSSSSLSSLASVTGAASDGIGGTGGSDSGSASGGGSGGGAGSGVEGADVEGGLPECLARFAALFLPPAGAGPSSGGAASAAGASAGEREAAAGDLAALVGDLGGGFLAHAKVGGCSIGESVLQSARVHAWRVCAGATLGDRERAWRGPL